MTQFYAVTAIDKRDNLDARMAARPDHLQYWQDNDAALVLAGPFLDGNEKPCGSLIVVRADDGDAARALIENDPYAVAGVFESVDIRPWNWVLKRPEGI